MKIEKTWSASSKPEEFKKGDELVNLAGQWNVGIKVSVMMPCTFSQGPVEKSIIKREAHDQRILPSPNSG